ncbi:hypothetical protein [Acidomonas methanolica]|uniref:hypothetical protein n=1 Tax=Acidomonas methanolica TaxID=437 RepID=UPI00211A92CF|nr:hypothetical protein [Acidomonas methanolica]MCQ9154903.1 hypothetical protein [Acidomonas methanolica]
MHVEQRTGSIPGIVFATVRHGSTARTITVSVARTETGRFVAKLPSGKWSIECMTAENAILMHAALIFPIEIESAPWLANAQKCPITKNTLSATKTKNLAC